MKGETIITYMFNVIVGILIAIIISFYVASYYTIWNERGNISIWGYLFVFVLLSGVVRATFVGVKYITHTGKKIKADFLSLGSMSDEQFEACFETKKNTLNPKQFFIVRYNVDGETFWSYMSINRLLGLVPGKKGDIYVVVHKMGVKTECQVFTVENIVKDYCIGIPCLLADIAWIILFLCRGL